MGLPIYVDICAHTRARTTWSLLSTVSFVGGNLSELYICRSPLFNFCPVMVLQLPCRYHGLTRPLAPGLISKAVATGTIEVFTGNEKCEPTFNLNILISVTDPSVTLARKVGLGLQDLQKRGRRILVERNAKKAEEKMWIGRMVVAESIGELDGLIRSRAA